MLMVIDVGIVVMIIKVHMCQRHDNSQNRTIVEELDGFNVDDRWWS